MAVAVSLSVITIVELLLLVISSVATDEFVLFTVKPLHPLSLLAQ